MNRAYINLMEYTTYAPSLLSKDLFLQQKTIRGDHQREHIFGNERKRQSLAMYFL